MLVLLFVISVLALTPANAEARELKTASGHWALNVPRAFKPAPNAPNAAFKMILEDEYHTLVLDVVKEGSVDWKELSPIYQDDDKAFGLQRLLSSVLESSSAITKRLVAASDPPPRPR